MKNKKQVTISAEEYAMLRNAHSKWVVADICDELKELIGSVIDDKRGVSPCPYLEVLHCLTFLHMNYHDNKECPHAKCLSCEAEKKLKKRLKRGELTVVPGSELKQ